MTDARQAPAFVGALPAGLGTALFGCAGMTMFGAAFMLVLNRSADPALHHPPLLIVGLFALGALWIATSAGLLRRASWARLLAVIDHDRRTHLDAVLPAAIFEDRVHDSCPIRERNAQSED